MEEDPQHKTPTELGDAVAKKIDELFGNLLGDQPTQGAEKAAIAEPATGSTPPTAAAKPSPARATSPPPVPRAVPSEPTVRLPDAPTFRKPGAPSSFEDVVDQIEALVLKVEWEASSDAIGELSKHFRELNKLFAGDDRARLILGMNAKVLERFKNPEVAPHPLMVKLLQGSVEVLKSICRAPENRSATDKAVQGLRETYNKIVTAEAPRAPEARSPGKGVPAAAVRETSESIMEKIGLTTQSLQEVSGRLTRIVGLLMQSGGSSGDETGRRLKTLEQVLSQRVGELSLLHSDLARTGPVSAGMPVSGADSGSGGGIEPEGLMMAIWSDTPVAIAASVLTAAYPLSKEQAEQFMNKPTLTLGSQVLQKLPLKPPSERRAATPLPAWLFHLKIKGKDFFLLADRSLGFRRVPKGFDMTRGSRIKIGPTSYTVLSQFSLRRLT